MIKTVTPRMPKMRKKEQSSQSHGKEKSTESKDNLSQTELVQSTQTNETIQENEKTVAESSEEECSENQEPDRTGQGDSQPQTDSQPSVLSELENRDGANLENDSVDLAETQRGEAPRTYSESANASLALRSSLREKVSVRQSIHNEANGQSTESLKTFDSSERKFCERYNDQQGETNTQEIISSSETDSSTACAETEPGLDDRRFKETIKSEEGKGVSFSHFDEREYQNTTVSLIDDDDHNFLDLSLDDHQNPNHESTTVKRFEARLYSTVTVETSNFDLPQTETIREQEQEAAEAVGDVENRRERELNALAVGDVENNEEQELEGAVGGLTNDPTPLMLPFNVRDSLLLIHQCLEDLEFSAVNNTDDDNLVVELHERMWLHYAPLCLRDHVRLAGEPERHRSFALEPELGDAQSLVNTEDRMEGRRCLHCGERSADVLIWPCGHLVICHVCLQYTNICPQCHILIEAFEEA